MKLEFKRAGQTAGALITAVDFGRARLIIDNAALTDDGVPTLNLEFFTPDDRRVVAKAVRAAASGSGVTAILEAEINDALARENQSLYRLNAGGTLVNARVQGTLKTSNSRSSGASASGALPEQQTAPGVEAPAQEQAEQPAPEPQSTMSFTADPKPAPASKKSPLPWIIAGALLLLAIIAALWFFLWPKGAGEVAAPQDQEQVQESATLDQEPQTQENAAEEQNSAAPVQTAGSASAPCALASSSSDSELLKNCLATRPDAGQLLALANEAQQAGRCEIAVRVYSSLGRTGDGEAAYIYADLFNPASDATSTCVKKDETQARYWYEKARDLGDDALKDKARKALESLQGGK